MTPPSIIAARMISLLESSELWDPDPAEPGDAESCALDRHCADLELEERSKTIYPVIDLEPEAAAAKYANGKRKRYRWPPVDLRTRKVLIVLHQAGVERGEARWRQRGHLVTGHRGIGPTGNRYRIHPLDCRLVAANRLDRSPWHAISIEVLGNFEGVHGSGDWYKPERFGRGIPGDAQLEATRQEILEIIDEVEEIGGEVMGIAPHRISGRDKRGKPNRPICCGSRIWSECGEWAGAVHGLRIPPDGFSIGGLPVPGEWHGRWYSEARRWLA